MIKTLICTKCLQEKDITLFVKSNLVKCGYTSTCKSCYNKIRQERAKYQQYTPVEYKMCPTCSTKLHKDYFYKNTRHSSGLSTECIKCTRVRSKNNHIKRGDRDSVKSKIRYANNSEKRRAEKRNYMLANPEVHMLSAARSRARRKKLEFNITREDIIIPEKCPILNVTFKRGTRGDYKYSPSLDRIDNTKGYIKGNIQIISSLANTMKNSATKEELIAFSKHILNKYNDDIVRTIGK